VKNGIASSSVRVSGDRVDIPFNPNLCKSALVGVVVECGYMNEGGPKFVAEQPEGDPEKEALLMRMEEIRDYLKEQKEVVDAQGGIVDKDTYHTLQAHNDELYELMMNPEVSQEENQRYGLWDPRFQMHKDKKLSAANSNEAPAENSSIFLEPAPKEYVSLLRYEPKPSGDEKRPGYRNAD